MRERQLYEAINRRLPKTIHHQGMTGASMAMNGTPDRYYDGSKSDLWVEYKQFDSMPRNGIVCCAPVPNVKQQPKGHLTTLQLQWLERRWKNAGNAVVFAGLPDRTLVILTDPEDWRHGALISTAISRKDAAIWIQDYCGGYSSLR